MSYHLARLQQFLASRGRNGIIDELTPDASTREYYRIRSDSGSTTIACVYPEAFNAAEQSYLDVTNLFKRGGLPVADVLDHDEILGIILLEDFGDTILRDVLQNADAAERERLTDRAIGLIAQIQNATPLAFELDSIASKLKFDREKLLWELEFFREHYFGTLKKRPLSPAATKALSDEFAELAEDLESRASVLCHRDFHAANLMVDARGELCIIDHQDARIGSPAYDLVSLLLDRITEPPPADWLAAKRRFLLDRRALLGMKRIDEAEFTEEFRLQTIQRCLKAAGTFSFQTANRGKTYFIPFIKPMFQIVLRAIDNVERFPELRSTLAREAD